MTMKVQFRTKIKLKKPKNMFIFRYCCDVIVRNISCFILRNETRNIPCYILRNVISEWSWDEKPRFCGGAFPQGINRKENKRECAPKSNSAGSADSSWWGKKSSRDHPIRCKPPTCFLPPTTKQPLGAPNLPLRRTIVQSVITAPSAQSRFRGRTPLFSYAPPRHPVRDLVHLRWQGVRRRSGTRDLLN